MPTPRIKSLLCVPPQAPRPSPPAPVVGLGWSTRAHPVIPRLGNGLLGGGGRLSRRAVGACARFLPALSALPGGQDSPCALLGLNFSSVTSRRSASDRGRPSPCGMLGSQPGATGWGSPPSCPLCHRRPVPSATAVASLFPRLLPLLSRGCVFLSFGFCARPTGAIYRPGFAVDLTFQSLHFNVPWQADPPAASGGKYFQRFSNSAQTSCFLRSAPLILRRKSTAWAARTLSLDVILLCGVAFPNAAQPFLGLNIDSRCPFLAKGAERRSRRCFAGSETVPAKGLATEMLGNDLGGTVRAGWRRPERVDCGVAGNWGWPGGGLIEWEAASLIEWAN